MSETPPRGGKEIIAAVAVTLTVQTLAAMAMIAPSVIAPVAADHLNVAPQSIGVFVSISYLAAMFSGLVSGHLIARFGPLVLCQAAVVLVGCGLLLGQLATAAIVSIAALLIGFGYGFVTPASSQILARRTPPRMMALIFSVKQTGVPIGAAIAGAVMPSLVLIFGWQGALSILAGVCIGVGLSLAVARRPVAEQRTATGSLARSLRRAVSSLDGPIRLVLTHDVLRELAFASLGYGAVQLVFITYFVSYLNLALGYSLVAAGLVYAFAHGAGIIGRIVWGAVADRWMAPRAMLAMLGGMSAVSGLLSATFSPAWPLAAVVAVAVLFGASAVGWNGVYLAEVARSAPPGQVGTATGGAQFFTFAGAFAGPPLFAGAVSVSASYAVAFALFALPSFVIGVRLFKARSAASP
jgi:MFS family permease